MGFLSPSYTDQTTTSKGGGSSESKHESESERIEKHKQDAYYDQLLGQANNLYKQGMPKYYGGATVAGFTGAGLEAQNQAANWTTGGAQDMMGNQNRMYQQMMSGRVNTGAGSPYGDMAAAYTQQATDSAKQMMGNVRGGQVMSGQAGGSSRGDMLNNQVITDTNQQLSNNLAGMYNNAYNQAQNTQVNTLGQYGSIMSMPLQMSQALANQVGNPQQQLNQNLMNSAKARYDYNSMNPYRNIQMFKNLISGGMGGQVNTNTEGSQSGSSTNYNTTTTPVQGPSGLDKLKGIAGLVTTVMGIPGIG
jgi:hypothetical protein